MTPVLVLCGEHGQRILDRLSLPATITVAVIVDKTSMNPSRPVTSDESPGHVGLR